MKEKFSIFSPQAGKAEAYEPTVNFKKSPNKFAVCDPLTKPKDSLKFPSNQFVSSHNLDNLKKLPSEYSTLRQTLSYKPSNFEEWMHNGDKDKSQKQTNILRQTLNSKPGFKPKLEKSYTMNDAPDHFHSSFDLNQKPSVQQDLTYSRKTNYVPDTKSLRSIDYQNGEPSMQELREKWKSGGFKTNTN